MEDYLKLVIEQLGISVWMFVVLIVWSYTWKLLALWKSARKNSVLWFIVFALVNTMGILEILYLFVFSKMKVNNFKRKKSLKRRR